MVWRIEDLPSVEADLDRIFDHVFRSQLSFGYGPDEAAAFAEMRILDIARSRSRLAQAPHIGMRHMIGGSEIRHVTLDRAIFWFRLDEDRETVVIEGIFHGGQDHLGHMLSRLTGEGGAD